MVALLWAGRCPARVYDGRPTHPHRARPRAQTAGPYRAAFRVPDRHGVFKFVLDYRRRGWTSLRETTTTGTSGPSRAASEKRVSRS